MKFNCMTSEQKKANWEQICFDLADVDSFYKNLEFLKDKPLDADELDELEPEKLCDYTELVPEDSNCTDMSDMSNPSFLDFST